MEGVLEVNGSYLLLLMSEEQLKAAPAETSGLLKEKVNPSHIVLSGGYGEDLKVKISISILINSLKTLSILKLMFIKFLQ